MSWVGDTGTKVPPPNCLSKAWLGSLWSAILTESQWQFLSYICTLSLVGGLGLYLGSSLLHLLFALCWEPIHQMSFAWLMEWSKGWWPMIRQYCIKAYWLFYMYIKMGWLVSLGMQLVSGNSTWLLVPLSIFYPGWGDVVRCLHPPGQDKVSWPELSPLGSCFIYSV
jgi:hypothetical protein